MKKKEINDCIFVGCVFIFLGLNAAIFHSIKPIPVWIDLFISSYDAKGLVLYLVVISCVFVGEAWVLGWQGSSIRKLVRPNKSDIGDMVIASLYVFRLSGIFVIFLTLGSTRTIPNLIDRFLDVPFLHYFPSHLLQFAIYFLAVDFILYWYHRVSHDIGFLWEVHKYHHSATNFTILTGNRVHPIEYAIRNLILAIPLALIGAPLESFLTIKIVIQVIQNLQHSMVNWRWGWIGKWLIYSPVGHRIHHSKEKEHWNKNFGDVLVLWDRMFGTWYAENDVNSEVGVSNNIYNKNSLFWDMKTSSLLFLKRFGHSLKCNKWKT